MANMHRGFVRLGEGGDADVLRLDMNALCRLEEEHAPFEELAQRLQGGRLVPLRQMVWGMMLHDRPDATLEDAGDLITRHGLEAVNAALEEVLNQGGLAPAEGEGDAPGEARAG